MGLKTVYERFLASPNPLSLHQGAVLQYVTTLTTFTEQGPVIRHLETQNKNVVKKKSEKIISVIEGLNSIAVITETTLEFLSSGGAYLPNLDNFVVDRIATFPVTHFVHFDQDEKITSIRLSWDQGDLLRQVEVIGSRGKNWPVYDGKEQIKLIAASSTNVASLKPAPPISPRGRAPQHDTETPPRSVSPSKKYIKDPHTSLDTMFQGRVVEEDTAQRRQSNPGVVSPRESAKPPPREMSELFAAGHEDYAPTRPDGSPNKVYRDNVVAPKGAGHKKFQPSRLFDDYEEAPQERKIYKTNPARYNHFDLGDPDVNDTFQYRPQGTQAENVPIRPKIDKKNVAQWDFQDVVTPEKTSSKARDQDGTETTSAPVANTTAKMRREDESHFDIKDGKSPGSRPVANKGTKDGSSRFNTTNEPTPAGRRIIARTKAAEGLYRDPIFGEEDPDAKPLTSLSGNTKQGGQARKKLDAGNSFWDF